MKTLIEHVESLSKHCDDRPEVILWSILHNDMIIDDDSLLVYDVEIYPFGNELNVMWGDGDGRKIEGWVMKVAKENNCVLLHTITKRWKPYMRRFHAKPVGMMLYREVI